MYKYRNIELIYMFSSKNTIFINSVLFFVLFLFNLEYSLANEKKSIDSLQKIIDISLKSKPDYSKIQNMVIRQLVISQKLSYTLYLDYSIRGLRIAEKSRISTFIAAMYTEIGRAYNNLGRYDLSIQNFFKSIDIYKKDNCYNAVIFNYNDIGNIYFSRRLFEIAKDVYQDAVHYGEKHRNEVGVLNAIAVTYNNIGLCERELNNFESSKSNFLAALKIRNDLKLDYLIPHSLNYIADLERRSKNYKSADSIYNEAIKISKSNIVKYSRNIKYSREVEYDLNDFYYDSYIGIVKVYGDLGNFKQMQTLREEAESVINSENSIFRMEFYKSIIPYYFQGNQIDSVLRLSKWIYQISDSVGGLNFKIFASKSLMTSYILNKNSDSALKYLEDYYSLKDSISNSRFDVLTYKFQKDETIKESNEAIKLIEEESKRDLKYQFLISIIAFTLFLLTVIILIFLYKKYKLNNRHTTFLNSVINSLDYPFYVIDYNSKKIELTNYNGIKSGIDSVNNYYKVGESTVFSINQDDINRIDSIIYNMEGIITDKEITDSIGEKKNLRIYNYPVLDKNGKVVKVIEYIFNITKYKKIENEKEDLISLLKEKNIKIETEAEKVMILNNNLKDSEKNLLLLNNTKDKFFSIIAHDLKNPLGTFKNLTKLLVDSYNDFDDNERIETLNLLIKSSNTLYSLLENLLEWSKSQRGQIQFKPSNFNLYNLIDEVIQLITIMAQNKNIQIINNSLEDIIVYGDQNIIRTVLRNIISNAVKFTHTNGKVIINCSEDNESIIISISDTGIGMSENIIQKLFKIDSSISSFGTNNEPGTGLGLILCKELILRHSGKIWVESEINKGTTFYFSIPKN